MVHLFNILYHLSYRYLAGSILYFDGYSTWNWIPKANNVIDTSRGSLLKTGSYCNTWNAGKGGIQWWWGNCKWGWYLVHILFGFWQEALPELNNAVNVSGLSDGLIYILISIVSFISIIFQSAEITISHPVIRVCSNISSHSLFTIDMSNIVTQNLEVLFIDHFKLLENYEKYQTPLAYKSLLGNMRDNPSKTDNDHFLPCWKFYFTTW